ncbi:MAG: hypothetical protein JWR80_1077 [Bradyrhizobium sp.]|nr:hypothetical protein [Bradyrhizobium sp.]
MWGVLKATGVLPPGSRRRKPALTQDIPQQVRHLIHLKGFSEDDPGDLRLARDTIVFLADD